MRSFHSIIEMEQVAAKRGGKCLSTIYSNSKTKLRWRCAKGHEWEALPASILQGHWCPNCLGKNKNISEMQAIAQQRGGICLSGEYKNNITKLLWKCAEGHEWEAIPTSILQGHWCPNCASKIRFRHSIEKMQDVARAFGGECLSINYVDTRTKLRWRCARGHEWEAIPNSVLEGSWCPYCAGTALHSIEEMRKLATKRGGMCISDKYVNNRIKLLWRCAEGHEWKTAPTMILQGYWCPRCARRVCDSTA